jgi:3-mercaptopyruvate sulfurtransferase SseA
MRIILVLLMMSCLAIGFACQNSTNAAVKDDEVSIGSDGANRITLAGAKKLFDSGNVLIVDTRGKGQYDGEHIKGAINVPLADVETRLSELKTDKKIVAYCS